MATATKRKTAKMAKTAKRPARSSARRTTKKATARRR